MAERQDDVRKHYGIPALAAKFIDALQTLGIDTAHLKAEQLYPFDQLHGRNIEATRDHVGRLALKSGERVLDVGSGAGGPARYIATTTGAHVTGLDLTPEFVATAQELSKRCGLEGSVAFQEGDALAMPFAANTFDAALCLYVAMNIEAKAKLASEIARVLKPGGRLVWSEVVLGGQGEPQFPLPWAREAGFSFLTKPETLRAAIEGSGLNVVDWVDERGIVLDWIKARQQAAVASPPPAAVTIQQMLMGDDFTERVKNYGRNMMEGRIGSVAFVAEKSR